MEPVSILAMLFISAGLALATRAGHKPPTFKMNGHGKKRRSGDMFEPVTHREVVERALAQRGSGTYHLGGGAIYTAPSVYSAEHNNHPGQCDCTGLLAYSAKYRRGPWNTDAIVDDAKGSQTRFRKVEDDEEILPGDFIITGRGHKLSDHAGIIYKILPGFVRRGPKWWEHMLVIHCSGRGQLTIDPGTGGVFGATRVTDATTWRRTGYIIRPLHVV